jgi:hypothetical protein
MLENDVETLNYGSNIVYLSPVEGVSGEHWTELIYLLNTEAFQVIDDIHSTNLSAMFCDGYFHKQHHASEEFVQ